MCNEHLHRLGEIHQSAGRAIDPVGDHHIHPARLDTGQQPLQHRTLRGAAGIVAVVEEDLDPALMALADDVGGGLVLPHLPHAGGLYRQRHKAEIMFGRLRDWRRSATRYDRCAHTFCSDICIAATVLFWHR